jgi:hypothetical protein
MNKIGTIKEWVYNHFIQTLMGLIILVFGFLLPTDVQGDFYEYLSQTESITNFRLDLQQEDFEEVAFEINKSDAFSRYYTSLKEYSLISPEEYINKTSSSNTFHVQKNKVYGIHFFGYSLLISPFYALFRAVGANPIDAYRWVNIGLTLLVLFYLLRFSSLNLTLRNLLAFLFLFSGMVWYIRWTHPEVYSTSLMFLGILTYYDKRYSLSALVIALASLQNPPIAFLLPLIVIYHFIETRNFWKTIQIAAIGSICIIPPVYSFFKFGTPNLIIENGFVSSEYLTFDRFFSFFFDLNQGLIVTEFIVLPVFIYFLMKDLIGFRRKPKFNILFPIVMILMALSLIQQTNWVGGCNVIYRYALWVGVIPITYIIFEHSLTKRMILIIVGVQVIVILLIGIPARLGHTSNSIFGEVVFSCLPSLYNPDPQIFWNRNNPNDIEYGKRPIIFRTLNNEITKILFFENSLIDNIPYLESLDKNEVEHQVETKSFKKGYIYINL